MWYYLQEMFSILSSTFFPTSSVWSAWIRLFFKRKISGILVYRILQFIYLFFFFYKSNHFASFYFSFCSVDTLHSHWSCLLPKAYMQLLVRSGNVLLLYQGHTFPKKLFCRLSTESYVLLFFLILRKVDFYCSYLHPQKKSICRQFVMSLRNKCMDTAAGIFQTSLHPFVRSDCFYAMITEIVYCHCTVTCRLRLVY